MKKLIFILLLFTSCITKKPLIETVTICDDVKAKEYVDRCISEMQLDSSSERLKKSVKDNCWVEARNLFCKKVTQQVKR